MTQEFAESIHNQFFFPFGLIGVKQVLTLEQSFGFCELGQTEKGSE